MKVYDLNAGIATERRIRFRMTGNLLKLDGMDSDTVLTGGGRRGAIKGFSRASRRRLLYRVAECGDALPIFVTLTYGASWPDNPVVWKRHLDTWWKRVKREDSTLGAIWKLEFQKRGAPHFHLLVYRKDKGRPFLEMTWVAHSWAAVTGDESPEHVRAGTRVEAIRSVRGAMFYASKYLAKSDGPSPDPACLHAGRVWGCLSGSNLPIETTSIWFSTMEAAAFRYHLAQCVADWRSKAKGNSEGYDDFDRGQRAHALYPGYFEDLMDNPARIPRTTIGDRVSILAQIQASVAMVEGMPDSEVAKFLERLESSS